MSTYVLSTKFSTVHVTMCHVSYFIIQKDVVVSVLQLGKVELREVEKPTPVMQ